MGLRWFGFVVSARYNPNVPDCFLTLAPMRLPSALCAVLLCLPLLAAAQLRTIPPDAIKAKMKPPVDGMVEVGKYTFRLAPGAQIRSTDNRILLPVMIDSEQVVRYTLDNNGDLYRVWVLSPEEIDLPAPKQ